MNALCHAGECARALEVFREMIKRKLEPGLVSCNYVLTYCSKHKEGMVAMEFLIVMKKVRTTHPRTNSFVVFWQLYRLLLCDETRVGSCVGPALELVFLGSVTILHARLVMKHVRLTLFDKTVLCLRIGLLDGGRI